MTPQEWKELGILGQYVAYQDLARRLAEERAGRERALDMCERAQANAEKYQSLYFRATDRESV